MSSAHGGQTQRTQQESEVLEAEFKGQISVFTQVLYHACNHEQFSYML
jgi:hypothetical protein